MDTRRAFFGAAVGAAATAIAQQAKAQHVKNQPTGAKQTTGDQQQARALQADGLQNRGAPTGRIGAATRGARDHGDLAVDLVAPLRGTGLTAVDQPELCYVLSGKTMRRFRLTISTSGLARPLADLELPSIPESGLGVLRLRDHRIQLPAGRLCIWSLTLPLDPRAPSEDLVCSALIQYRPDSPAFRAANRQASVATRVAALAHTGYWYDAIALARHNQPADHGTALASLFTQADLPLASIVGSAR